MNETIPEVAAKPAVRNGTILDRATTYVSLTLTITVVVLGFQFGSRLALIDTKLQKLDKVPPREEVQLIVRDEVAPLQKELWVLKTEVELLKAAVKTQKGSE